MDHWTNVMRANIPMEPLFVSHLRRPNSACLGKLMTRQRKPTVNKFRRKRKQWRGSRMGRPSWRSLGTCASYFAVLRTLLQIELQQLKLHVAHTIIETLARRINSQSNIRPFFLFEDFR